MNSAGGPDAVLACHALLRSPASCAGAVILAALAGLFGDGLLSGRFLAFRDSMHFFPPLYRLVAGEWQAGRVPLWNPWLNGGQPLAATNTAGAFYPPQLLATCLLPDGVSLDVLMIGHVAVAAAGAFMIARDAGASVHAAIVAALGFACSGSVLFHVYAPNILAGVAWTAWAVRSGLRLLEKPSVGQSLCLAIALAMAVLAGDPQSVFHAGIAIGILLLCRLRRLTDEPDHLSGRTAVTRGGVIVTAALLGGLLSLVQLAITREFMLTTTRYTDAIPLSIWDVPAFWWRAPPETRSDWCAVLIGRPPPGVGFYREIYRYSIAPWWPLECLSPTLCGRFLSRWPHELGWEGHAWVATLYAGMIPLACATLALMNPRARREAAGWIVLLVFSYLAAIWGFGIAGAVRHLFARATGAADVPFYRPGDELGGVYWMLTTLVPGYSGFRYPAKWLTIFALAFSQLAASGFDVQRGDEGTRRRSVRLFAILGVLAMLVTAGALPQAGPASPLVLAGGLLSVAVAAVACLLAILVRRGALAPSRCSMLLVTLVAVDLVVAGRLHMFTSPFGALVDGGAALETLRARRLPALAAVGGAPRVTAIDDAIHLPRSDDPAERAMFTGMAMRCHTPLLHGWGKVGEPSTAMDADLELFFHAPRSWRGSDVFARRMFDSAAVEFFVIPRHPPRQLPLTEFEFDWSDAQKQGSDEGLAPGGGRMPGMFAQRPGMSSDDVFVKYVRNESALPRARIAGSVVRVDPISDPIGHGLAMRLADIAFPNPRIPFLGSTAVVESAAAIEVPERTGTGTPSAMESCRIVVDEPRRVVVEATLEAPALVVLADTFHPDWSLSVRSGGGEPQDLHVLRVNRIHRGCLLPAGRHVLEYTHLSRTFERTWPITAAAWVATLAAAGMLWLRRPRAIP